MNNSEMTTEERLNQINKQMMIIANFLDEIMNEIKEIKRKVDEK